LKQHFIYKYDPEYVDELNRPDYDPHLDLALMAGAVSQDDVRGYKAEDKQYISRIKPIRSIYKNGNYACQYGAGVSRLAITCGCDVDTARRIHEAYWKRNWAIKRVTEDQIVKTVRGQMWLYNPISEYWYSLRYVKDIFSTLVQGSAVYCFDLWVRTVLDHRPQLTGQFHDEIIQHVKKGFRQEVTEFLQGTIEEVNQILQLNRRLDIGIQFGSRYSEIH
jgi:DNA polymerase I-like protein with 3'-5' exonuclease and polymerase domains